MNQPPEIIQPSAENLNRRDILKVLAASGSGLLAAAFLPGKWLKPVIEAGVLPAHAQTSRCVTGEPGLLRLSNAIIHCDYYDDKMGKYYYTGTVDYYDSCCEVGSGQTDSVWTDNESAEMDGYNVEGDECSGVISFGFWATPVTRIHGNMTVNERKSNTLSIWLHSC